MTILQKFCAENKIRAKVESADDNPNMDAKDKRSMNHYRVTLRRGDRRMTVPFSTGMGWTREPDAADVLNCLISDASGFLSACDFEDWCSEYGYDTDSRRAERTFKLIDKQTTKVRNFLGELWDDAVAHNDH